MREAACLLIGLDFPEFLPLEPLVLMFSPPFSEMSCEPQPISRSNNSAGATRQEPMCFLHTRRHHKDQ